jgi:hypothetical protein
MEEFTLPSVGASFKKWECCTPILPECQAHFHNTKKKSEKNSKIVKKGGTSLQHVKLQVQGYPTTSGRPPAKHMCPKLAPLKFFLLPHAHKFLHMWSILIGWLQHMLALLRLLLKFSNIHNF